MDNLTFITKLVEALALPFAIIAVVIILRKHLIQLLGGLGKLKLGKLEIEMKAKHLNQEAKILRSDLAIKGFNPERITQEAYLEEAPIQFQLEAAKRVEQIEADLLKIKAKEGDVPPSIAPETLLTLASALLAAHKWTEATEYLDEYVRHRPEDWEAQRSRGVAYARSGGGGRADREALRAYSEALALVPANVDPDSHALLYNYRGAMLKRLRRFVEAETDLRIALSKATNDILIKDIHYNLAGVYAMMEKGDEAMSHLRQLKGSNRELSLVRKHLNDYFAGLKEKVEFQTILDSI